MEKLLTKRQATNSIFAILSAVVVFHGLVMLQIIPSDIVWGGKQKTTADMLMLETVSITVNLLMLAIIALKAGFIKLNIRQIFIKTALWLMTGLFLLNTLGNIFSENTLERIIFTPLTLILAILCFRLARDNDEQ